MEAWPRMGPRRTLHAILRHISISQSEGARQEDNVIEKVLGDPETEEREQVTLTNEEIRDQVAQILKDSPSLVRRKGTKETIKRGPYKTTVTKDMRTRGRTYDPIKRRPTSLDVRRSHRQRRVPSRLVDETAALMAEFKSGMIAKADPRLDVLVAQFLKQDYHLR